VVVAGELEPLLRDGETVAGNEVWWATTTGVTRAGPVEVTLGWVARFGCWAIMGAWTTLRPGPGPSAIPSGPAGAERRRGITAPPATATARRNAAIRRSFRLMFSPSPADNFS
jgi:hypothetical protein